ncbi:MAG: hypothetical protein ABIH37_04475 [archaeon]
MDYSKLTLDEVVNLYREGKDQRLLERVRVFADNYLDMVGFEGDRSEFYDRLGYLDLGNDLEDLKRAAKHWADGLVRDALYEDLKRAAKHCADGLVREAL